VKKRLTLAVAFLVLTACAVALCARPGSSITFGAYERIRVGMTRQQVEEVLSGPPRDESAYSEHLNHFCKWPGRALEWWGPDIAIFIEFDNQRRVCDKSFMTHDIGPGKKPSLWD
jgi:hypothetical protein